MLHLLRALSVRSIVWFAVLVAIPELLPGTAAAQNTAAALSLSPRLLADASWHGRQIQRPLARRSDIADRKPSLGLGTGFSRPGGSRRVRDLQRRLARLGYRPGTPDGLFGTRTQAAVLAFQRKHGLRRTGSVGSGVLRVLRHRTTPGATPAPLVQTQSEPSPAPATPTPAPRGSAPNTPVSDSGGTPLLASILLLTLAILLLMVASLVVRGRVFPALEGPRSRTPRELEPPPAPAFDSMPAPAPVEHVLAPEAVPARELAQAPSPQPLAGPRRESARHHRRPAPTYYGSPRERREALRARILAMRADGMTLQMIADQLTAEGEVTLGGRRQWQPWSVRAATRPLSPSGRPIPPGRRETQS
jgi:peptidoglycan hydrolase-like protein with peptidoglycan-binding domain